jgi:hypothetical protein
LRENDVTSEKFWKDEEVNELIESVDVENIDCGPEGDGDEIDAAIEGIMDMLVANDYEEKDAEDAVFEAMHNLIAREEISDTPETISEESEKQSWINNFNVKIREELKNMGLDFEG